MLLSTCLMSLGQNLSKGDEAFDRLEFKRAIKYYKDYLKKDPNNYEVNKKLATCYLNTRQYDEMLYTYEHIIDGPNVQNDDYYTIAKLYMMNNNMSKARKYSDMYSTKSPGEKAQYLKESITNLPKWLAKGTEYVQDMTTGSEISKYSVVSPMLYEDDLLVTIEALHKDIDQWGENHYLEVYNMTNSLKLGGSYMNLKGMKSKHESQSAIDEGARRYYFTSNHTQGDAQGNIDIYKLKISYIDLADRDKTIQDFAYNDMTYNVCHPAISPDASMLVFASDMPGGSGGMDLYLCRKSGSGEWSQPQNISELNTYGNEKFPSFVDGGSLAFSSDALPGMGGMDIFISEYSGSRFGTPTNPGAIINSTQNDFGLATMDYKKSGYLTTNRNTQSPRYEVIHYTTTPAETIVETLEPTKKLNVLVLDKYTDIPLPGVQVHITKSDGTKVATLETNAEGKISTDIPRGTVATVSGTKNDISTTTAQVGLLDYESDDAVIFKKLYHNDPRFTLIGEVRERKSKSPVSSVRVKLDNESKGTSVEEVSARDGSFSFQLEQNSDYTVKGHKSGIYSNSTSATTKGLDRSTTLYAKLYLNVDIVCLGNNLVIDNIYYDYDKSNIRQDARKPLNELVDLLNDYPDMRIELSSHTDSRGSTEYNDKLSQDRAESAVRYLSSRGISSSRMVAKGYGERNPYVKCSSCTEAQHQSNRRTEIQILECPSCPACE